MSYERTPEHRQRQAERVRQWRPWEKSSGPRTEAGKSASSRNALKHGGRAAEPVEVRDIRASIKRARAFLARLVDEGLIGRIR